MTSRLLASAALPAGLAGAVLCSTFAQAGDSATDGGLAFAGALNAADDQAYIRTAQLEWLFGGQRQWQPQERARSRQVQEPGRSGEGTRYIIVPRRDFMGNVTYERVPAREHSRDRAASRVDSKNDRIRTAVAEKLRAAPAAPPTNGPLLITVSLARQQLTLYDQGVPIARSPVSSGTQSHPTPTGVFSILQKQYFHRSNMYSSAPMPYMQRITWAGVALHAGELPGYAASHGCVRLPEDFAIRLWGTTQPGVRVIITQNEVRPFPISHPLLFTPKQPKVPEIVPAPPPARDLQPQEAPVVPAPLPAPQADRDKGVSEAAAEAIMPASPPPAARNEIVVEAVAEKSAPTSAEVMSVSLLDEIADTIPAVAEITILRGGEQAVPADVAVSPERSPAEGERGVRTERITIVRGGQPAQFEIVDLPPVSRDVIGTAPQAAPAGKPTIGAQANLVAPDEAAIGDVSRLGLPDLGTMPPVLLAYAGNDLMQFARLQRRAESQPQAQSTEAPATPFVNMLRPGPVSVYISRRTQRIYVRKGFEAVFDMPITVSQPHVPMGTYVFTANALADDGTAFRWTAVSLADNRRAAADDGKAARAALDRIALPQEAVERISQIIGVGATLIVTDKGPGRAHAQQDNDFSVVLR